MREIRGRLEARFARQGDETAQIPLLRETLARAQETVGSWGGSLHFVFLPGMQLLMNPNGGRARLAQLVLQQPESLGIPVIDVRTSFQSHSIASIFFYPDSHYSELGAGAGRIGRASIARIRSGAIPDVSFGGCERGDPVNSALIDFVVSTRNNRAIIVPTLEAIARQTIERFTCTVVDGCSSDGTPDLVRERFPWVRVVVKESDSGPSNSRNIGFRQGAAEYAAFVDSDIVLDPRWAEQQVEMLKSDRSIAITGGKLLHSEKPGTLYAAYGVMPRPVRDGVGRWKGAAGRSLR